MKSILLVLVLIGNVFGQSNLYWQNGYYPVHVQSVYSESKTKHYFVMSGRKIQLTEDNFKTSIDVGSKAVQNWDALLLKDYAIYLSTSNHLMRYNFSSGNNIDLGESTADIFLKYSNSLFYYQDETGDIYSSNNQGVSWQFVKNTTKINSWGTSGKGYIYCSDNNHDIYRVDSLMEGKTVILPNSSLRYRDKFYTAGVDTVFFLSNSKLYRSFDSGNSFSITDFGSVDHGIKADEQGNFFILSRNALLKSYDKGENWEEVFFKRDYGGFFYINGNTIHLYYGNDKRVLYHDPDVSSPAYSNFFPLEVGNKWFYEATGDRHGFKTVEVYDSVQIASEKYFRINGFIYPLRYEDNKLLFHKNGTDLVYMDFNIPSGQRVLHMPNGQVYSMREGSFEMFDTTIYNKGPFFSAGIERVGTLYSPGIGKIFSTDYEIYGTSILENYDTLLVQAIINSPEGRVVYNNIPPPFFTSYVEVDFGNDTFTLRTEVKHEMSEINNYVDHTLVDKVRLDYFYSNGSTTHSPGQLFGTRQHYQEMYSFTGALDRTLIQNGYLLNFKFTAWTKGLIPMYKEYPTSGYLITDGTMVSLPVELTEEQKYKLEYNFPNPFNPSTTIRYTLRENSRVVLEVYNIQGQMARRLVEENQEAGEHTAVFDGSNLASGVYIARLRAVSQTGGEIFTKSIKMILMK